MLPQLNTPIKGVSTSPPTPVNTSEVRTPAPPAIDDEEPTRFRRPDPGHPEEAGMTIDGAYRQYTEAQKVYGAAWRRHHELQVTLPPGHPDIAAAERAMYDALGRANEVKSGFAANLLLMVHLAEIMRLDQLSHLLDGVKTIRRLKRRIRRLEDDLRKTKRAVASLAMSRGAA
jgi:hypothetical protein